MLPNVHRVDGREIRFFNTAQSAQQVHRGESQRDTAQVEPQRAPEAFRRCPLDERDPVPVPGQG